MKIIIAPAKKMKVNNDSFLSKSIPQFLQQTTELWDFLSSRSLKQLQDLWQVNSKLAQENFDLIQTGNLNKNLTPALFAYSGIQYQYLAADVLEQTSLDYLQNNLRIVSGLYGLLRPFDGVIPHRLEMQTAMDGFKNISLYDYWSNMLYKTLYKKDELVINLASKEYSKLFSPFVKDNQRFVTIDFLENKNGKWRQIATHSKMARGTIVNFMAKHQVNNLDELKEFSDFNYQFDQVNSTEKNLIFKKCIL